MTSDNRRRGWFRLWRSYFDSPIATSAPHCVERLLLRLMNQANWRRSALHDGTILEPGDVVVSRRQMAKVAGITQQQYRDSISLLTRHGFTTQRTTHRYSIVTLTNWRAEQTDDGDEEPSKEPAKEPTENPLRTQWEPTKNHILEVKKLRKGKNTNGGGAGAVDFNGLTAWFSENFPSNVFEGDVRLLLSVIESQHDEALLRAHLPLWKATRRWREGYAPTAENFLSKRMWTQPPKAETQAEGRPDDVWERVH